MNIRIGKRSIETPYFEPDYSLEELQTLCSEVKTTTTLLTKKRTCFLERRPRIRFTDNQRTYMNNLYELQLSTNSLSMNKFVNTCFFHFSGLIPKKNLLYFFKNHLYRHKQTLIKERFKEHNCDITEKVIDDICSYISCVVTPYSIRGATVRKYLERL